LTAATSALVFARFGITAVATYLAVAGAVITLCVWLPPETTQRVRTAK